MRRVRLCLVAAVVVLVAAQAPLAAAAPSAPSPGDPARRLRDSLFRDFGSGEAGDPPHDEPRGQSVFLWAADRGVAPDASSWITECASISPNATGNLSDANGTGCVLPANETSVVPSGSRIAGEGSLVLPEGAVLTCGVGATEYCTLTVALGTDARLVLGASARAPLRGFPERHRGRGGARRRRARVDADGRGDPGERRGWSGDGGAGYGGDGAACPGGDGTALPPHTGGAGYAFQEFINVGFFHKTSAPPPQGTGAGGAGGGAVVVARGRSCSGAAPPSPRTVPRPRPAPRIWAADRGDPSSCSPARWSLLPGTPRHGASCARAAARAPPRAAAAAAAAGGAWRSWPPPSGRPRCAWARAGGAAAARAARPGSTAPPARRSTPPPGTWWSPTPTLSPGASRRHRRCAWRTAPGARAR